MARWDSFWKWFSATSLSLLGLVAGLIWVIDPYNNLPYSPPIERAPAASNQRYAYPALARSSRFDSLVIGTSTTRLLDPAVLNKEMGGRFANLSMNSATAYEQLRLAQVFARHHQRAKYLIVGIDVVWCETGQSEKYTFRRFPEWMYDDNPWNDIRHLLEFKTFEVLGRQAGYLLGLRGPRYGLDGYRSFLPPRSEYDLKKAREKIYGSAEPLVKKASASAPAGIEEKRASWTFGSHSLLKRMLGAFPAETRKLLVFVPYHHFHLPAENSVGEARWNECRDRITRLARQIPNAAVLDFMMPSPITTRDENYWDPLHFSDDVAARFARLIADGAAGNPAPDGEYRILTP